MHTVDGGPPHTGPPSTEMVLPVVNEDASLSR
jgi:hypothetical protein